MHVSAWIQYTPGRNNILSGKNSRSNVRRPLRHEHPTICTEINYISWSPTERRGVNWESSHSLTHWSYLNCFQRSLLQEPSVCMISIEVMISYNSGVYKSLFSLVPAIKYIMKADDHNWVQTIITLYLIQKKAWDLIGIVQFLPCGLILPLSLKSRPSTRLHISSIAPPTNRHAYSENKCLIQLVAL